MGNEEKCKYHERSISIDDFSVEEPPVHSDSTPLEYMIFTISQ